MTAKGPTQPRKAKSTRRAKNVVAKGKTLDGKPRQRRPKGEIAQILDVVGIDAVCDAIMDQESLTAIARANKVATSKLLAWIEADKDRSARVRTARALTAKMWDEKAERVINDAKDAFGLTKARELAQHYRWRSTKIAPKEYGDRQTVEHDVSDNLAERMREARERIG